MRFKVQVNSSRKEVAGASLKLERANAAFATYARPQFTTSFFAATPSASALQVVEKPQVFAALNSIHCCANKGLVVAAPSLSKMQS